MSEVWVSVKDKEPPFNTVIKCKLQHWNTKGIQEYDMIRVKEDDHEWVTADDHSELDYNWNVVEWLDKQKP